MTELLLIIQGWIVSAGALGVFGASVAEEVISVIPSAAIQTAAGAFMMAGYPPSVHAFLRLIVTVVIPLALGVVIGSLPYVYIARRYGVTAIDRWGKYVNIHNHDIDKLRIKFSGTAWDDVLFAMARAFPVIPSIVLAVYAGIVQMSWIRYIVTTFIGVMLRATVFSIVGWLFASWVSSLQSVADVLEKTGIVVVVMGIIWVVYKISKKYFNT